MSSQKRVAIIFLGIINIMNIAAGIITQVEILTGSDVTSIIPISGEFTVNQILLINFTIITAVMLLINIITTYLATDVAYSPLEIVSNCAGIFMVIPVVLFIVGIFNAFSAPIFADKIWIILSGIFYVIANLINFGCILTIKEDAE